jgi:UDP-N-acetylmuramate--alanine ligase
MDFDQIKKIFFVGIGGIGMSALARYFNNAGKEILGYDRVATSLTRTLEAEGMKIYYAEDVNVVLDEFDLMVWTPAVTPDNLFLQQAAKFNIPLYKRAEILAMISRKYQSIAVAGTHGKTTTSSMIAWILRSGGIDCSAFLGGIAVNFNSNFLYGDRDIVVLEADEYDRSFLHLTPNIAIITSMDPDHLDIYLNGESIRRAYLEFVGKIKPNGCLIIHESVVDQVNRNDIEVISYGFGENSDYKIESLKVENGLMCFDIKRPKKETVAYTLPYPGKHNVENACAASIVAEIMGMNDEEIRKALMKFKGIKRRFEIVEKKDEFVIIDDYAHHPTEIKAAIEAARMFYPGKKLTGVFQPHLYSRTRDFYIEFAQELDQLDECVLIELYPAREEPIFGVSSKLILDEMKCQKKSLCSKEELIWRLLQMEIEVLIIMGAGDIDTVIPSIKEHFLNTN